jgi:hypothetical protein
MGRIGGALRGFRGMCPLPRTSTVARACTLAGPASCAGESGKREWGMSGPAHRAGLLLLRTPPDGPVPQGNPVRWAHKPRAGRQWSQAAWWQRLVPRAGNGCRSTGRRIDSFMYRFTCCRLKPFVAMHSIFRLRVSSQSIALQTNQPEETRNGTTRIIENFCR